ncbi:alpha/beta hydrolase [Leptospira semungkisensis]|uniref:Alpha/beta hydrolase n=1 Tax=Leptospira semungkisensis TaxID=2484985 RepID=A0A4R9G187_9LEPT|nr:alpha/beta hydrolase [Leptospira semungkisensis]TGK04963.1 alpha/beta hydrolase [Leptospira semungkisensis]
MHRKTFQFQGIQLSYIDSGPKEKAPILIAHANGFAAGCYSYLIRELSSTHRVIALDFCGHGNSEPNMNWKNWFFLRDQVFALIEEENLQNIVGIGHSMGGASLLLSSQKRPGLFSKIFALDPVVLNITYTFLSLLFGNPLARGAIKRRREFKSLDLVRKAFRKTPTFSHWKDEIFEDYLKSCLKQEGDKWVLCCPPEMEAKIFTSLNPLAFLQYGKFTTETHITIPKEYEVCSPGSAKRIMKGNPNSSLELWENTSHFFPFELPERTLERILKRL